MATFRDYGFSGVLVKPFRLEQMAQVLHQAMTDASAETRLPKKSRVGVASGGESLGTR